MTLSSEPDIREAMMRMGIPHLLSGRKPPSHRYTEILLKGERGRPPQDVIGDWWAEFEKKAAGAKAIHWRHPPEVHWIDATKIDGGHWGVCGRFYAEKP